MKHTLQRQRGITLLVALIMLLLLMLIAVGAMNLGKGSIQTVSNMQQRNEAYAAAQTVIEETISTTRFFDTPTNALASPCQGTVNTRCVDTNGDGTADVKVEITPAPSCVKAQGVRNNTLDVSNKEDAGCAVGQQQTFGIEGATTGNSMCANTVWEINAVATDVATEAKVEVVQGVAVRVSNDAVETSCPTPKG